MPPWPLWPRYPCVAQRNSRSRVSPTLPRKRTASLILVSASLLLILYCQVPAIASIEGEPLTKRFLPILLLLLSCLANAQSPSPAPHVLQRNVLAHEEFLASDALQGRGSGTRDEWIAATYVAAQFRQFGLEPAGNATT